MIDDPIITTQANVINDKPVINTQPNLQLPKKDERPIWEKLGWKKVASQSRPGEFSYENIYTEERIPDVPRYPASKEDGKSEDLALYD